MAISVIPMGLPTTADDRAPSSGERALLREAVAGKGSAFRALVEPHLPMLYRIALRACGNPAIAEDAVQEALALSYQKLGSYKHDRPFRSFLATIAAKQAHTIARGERRRSKRQDKAEGPQRPHDPHAELEGATAAARVREVIAKMPEKRRTATLLRLDGGMSYKEIAAAMDTSEGSARVLVHSALKQLKAELAELLHPSSSPTGKAP